MTGDRQLGELRFQLTGPEIERLVLVGGDLEYLAPMMRSSLLSHTEVRMAAAVMRRLLVDQQLNKVWRAIDPEGAAPLHVSANEIDTALSKWPESWVRYAYAGGGSAEGVANHEGLLLAAVPEAELKRYGSREAFLQANPLPMTGNKRHMDLKTWLKATSVAIQTNEIGLVRISRQSVLTYIANRKGGVHFDPSRDFTLPRNPRRHRREVESHLLDHGLLRVGHLSGPEFEVAAMIQALVGAEWYGELVRVAHEVAPDDFDGDPYELKFWSFNVEADGTGWATSRFEPPAPSQGGDA